MPQGVGYGPFAPRPPAAPDPDEESLRMLGIEPRRAPLPPMPAMPRGGVAGPLGDAAGAPMVDPSTSAAQPSLPPNPMPAMPAPPMGLDTNQGGPNELGGPGMPVIPGLDNDQAAEMYVRHRLKRPRQ